MTFHLFNDVRQVYLTKMFFHLLAVGKLQWLRNVETDEFRLPTLVLLPFFDDRFITDDFAIFNPMIELVTKHRMRHDSQLVKTHRRKENKGD